MWAHNIYSPNIFYSTTYFLVKVQFLGLSEILKFLCFFFFTGAIHVMDVESYFLNVRRKFLMLPSLTSRLIPYRLSLFIKFSVIKITFFTF